MLAQPWSGQNEHVSTQLQLSIPQKNGYVPTKRVNILVIYISCMSLGKRHKHREQHENNKPCWGS